jgi:hypothetical protein
MPSPSGKAVVKTGTRKSDGAKIVVYDDGTQEVIPSGR